MEQEQTIIIGAGAAGLSAALELAGRGQASVLISDLPAERAQSVMAEGGINAAFPSETDSPELHAKETLRAGRELADPEAVRGLTEAAPTLIKRLFAAGMAFTLDETGKPEVRAFGGQSVKRTFYAAANTGKQLMYTLIDQVRRYEAEGLITRWSGWLFLRLLQREGQAYGCEVIHGITQERRSLFGNVIVASGGLNGLFGNATGSVRNTGAVTASLFADGVAFANGEFIQYHPTTVQLRGKSMLITEAVRGEGGKLFVWRDGKPYYFMREKYPELGDLMPRDVISREEWAWMQRGKQVYLDMRHLPEAVREKKLKGVMEDCRQFLSLDPAREPIPVAPGIHYFMGGIWTDAHHRTSVAHLYAAGECACQYHGANRLGGNSLLGALYGGFVAARSSMEDGAAPRRKADWAEEPQASGPAEQTVGPAGCFVDGMLRLRKTLRTGLGIVRSEAGLQQALDELEGLLESAAQTRDETASLWENQALFQSCLLGKAMLLSAQARKESRGAHVRSDYPAEDPAYQKQTIAMYHTGTIRVRFRGIGDNDGA